MLSTGRICAPFWLKKPCLSIWLYQFKTTGTIGTFSVPWVVYPSLDAPGPLGPSGPVGGLLPESHYFGPNLNHHIPLLPGIYVRCGLCLPIAQVLPLSPGNAQLVSTIRDEDPERVPSKRSDQVLAYALTYQCLLKPSQASVTCARSGYHPLKVLTQSGNQVVHVPKAFQRRKQGQSLAPFRPPVYRGEGKLRGDPRDWVLFDTEGWGCFGLLGHHLNRVGCDLHCTWARVLKIIETGTTPHLESNHSQNECINGLPGHLAFLRRVSATGSRPLFQCKDDILGRDHCLSLWCSSRRSPGATSSSMLDAGWL